MSEAQLWHLIPTILAGEFVPARPCGGRSGRCAKANIGCAPQACGCCNRTGGALTAPNPLARVGSTADIGALQHAAGGGDDCIFASTLIKRTAGVEISQVGRRSMGHCAGRRLGIH